MRDNHKDNVSSSRATFGLSNTGFQGSACAIPKLVISLWTQRKRGLGLISGMNEIKEPPVHDRSIEWCGMVEGSGAEPFGEASLEVHPAVPSVLTKGAYGRRNGLQATVERRGEYRKIRSGRRVREYREQRSSSCCALSDSVGGEGRICRDAGRIGLRSAIYFANCVNNPMFALGVADDQNLCNWHC